MTSINVDLDTLDSVRYKMRSFLVGEPDDNPNNNHTSIQLSVPKAPSTGRVGSGAHIAHIPAYRLFETKRYDGPKESSTDRVSSVAHKEPSTVVRGRNPSCCICLNKIRVGAVVVSMPLCGHLYHKACLFNWVDLSKNTFCPYCRQDDF